MKSIVKIPLLINTKEVTYFTSLKGMNYDIFSTLGHLRVEIVKKHSDYYGMSEPFHTGAKLGEGQPNSS